MIVDEDSTIHPPDEHGDWVLLTDYKISLNRITIRKPAIERHGFREGQIVDAAFSTHDGALVALPETRLRTRVRVAIRAERVERHDLDGEFVDVWLRQPARGIGPGAARE